ncbi:MAG: AIR synthase-related protein, partial [Elusimicrobiota bacterium]|nr:AIR synthase-related protein [Elusimicrobiota bacterium]
ENLPEGVLHPKRIFKGVVKGVSDYGNRVGIPTANGAVLFDEGYVCNPVVYCGTVGIIPKDKCFKKVTPGDLIVAVGGKTGRDGIHGATFSSIALDKDTESSCVQIGNPIVEKKVLDTVLQARDKNLYTAITDCGAGGFSSAVGELGVNCGAKVYLERVPLKYDGLAPWEIWVSEAQERMVLSVPKKKVKKLLKVFRDEDVEATVIGEFTNTGKLEIFYKKEKVCDLDMDFLYHGVPRKKLKAVWQRKKSLLSGKLSSLSRHSRHEQSLGDVLKKVLSSLNVCSKDWVIRQYDYEVQGQTVIKPFVGKNNDGPSDATVIWPYVVARKNQECEAKASPIKLKGIAISNGINPKYSKIDTYWMAASCIDEALRNIICVGGNLSHTALLDNFTWGNPSSPHQLASLVRACQACYDMAKVYGTPFISGKDSLNNEFIAEGRKISVLPTLLVSAISVIEDIRKVITMDLKQPGNSIYILGITKDELGGSEICAVLSKLPTPSPLREKWRSVGDIGTVPTVNPQKAKLLMNVLSKAIKKGLVKSCHDCSEGGLAVSCAEMCFAGELGMEIDLSKVPVEFTLLTQAGGSSEQDAVFSDLTILFSESNSRFVVEVAPSDEIQFEKILKGNIYSKIGKVTDSKRFVVYGVNGERVVNEDIFELKNSWQKTLVEV